MKRHYLIDHLPIDKTDVTISDGYNFINYYLNGFSFTNTPFILSQLSSHSNYNRPCEIKELGSVKYIVQSAGQISVPSVSNTTEHGSNYISNGGLYYLGTVSNEFNTKTTVISFRVKFIKDAVVNPLVKNPMILTNKDNTGKILLFFEDFGQYRINDEFDVKIIKNSDSTAKSYIDGKLIANFITEIRTNTPPVGFKFIPCIGHNSNLRQADYGIRDIVIEGYDTYVESNDIVSLTNVPLISQDLNVNTTEHYDGTILPYTDNPEVLEKQSIVKYQFILDPDAISIIPSASIRLDKGFDKRIVHYYIMQDGHIVSGVGVFEPCYTHVPNITLDELFVSDTVDRSRPMYLCFEDKS